jgi:hypothetical protein
LEGVEVSEAEVSAARLAAALSVTEVSKERTSALDILFFQSLSKSFVYVTVQRH